MKWIYLFHLLVSQLLYSQIYFSEPTPSHTDYIDESGRGWVAYSLVASYPFIGHIYMAKINQPIQTSWMQGQTGGLWVSQAGTYTIQGRVYVTDILTGTSFWVEGPFVTWSVVDNYAPAVPQNFDVTVYSTDYSTHPKLTWTLNTEYDGEAYYIERRITGQQNFSFLTTVNWTTSQYIDNTINYAGGGPSLAEYKIRAHDINGHYSNYTSIESVHYGDAWKIGTRENNTISEYKLEQNYPNPFNPTTTISYSIPKNGLITLRVFDILGTEVAELINEFKEAGNFSVTFNAAELPSGIYFCTLTSGNFMDTKKLILLK